MSDQSYCATRRGSRLDHRRCVHCLRCRRDEGANLSWDSSYEWAAHRDDDMAPAQKLQRIFGRSLHIRFVDAGACGACMSEARQINNPYYNAHRLGFFMTPTPRNADVLMVSGPVSDAMRLPLRKTYDAMPEPKRVVAIGACAIFGGVFGTTFAASGGAGEIVPVDVVVPGCPPPPLAILHALLLARRTKAAVAIDLAAARAHQGAGMSTTALLLFDVFRSLRGWRGHGVSDSGAMERRRACGNRLIGCAGPSIGERSPSDRRFAVPRHACGPCSRWER